MGQRLGSFIGAVGGLLFMLLNAGPLPHPWSLVIRLVGIASFSGVVWFSVFRARAWPADPAPPARAIRIYWGCVVAEVVAIPVGSQVLLHGLHQPVLTPVWVVFVVGVHFLPFARAFRVPLFAALAAALIAVSLLGGLVTLRVGPLGAAWTGVAAGVLLLAFAVTGALRQRRLLPDRAAYRTR